MRLLLFSLLFFTNFAFASDPLAGHQQLMVVTTRFWDDSQGTLQRFERTDDASPWAPVGQLIPVVVGKAGLAWGVGLHPSQDGFPTKVEGDRRSPAGLFSIGTAFGFVPSAQMSPLKIDYLQLSPTIEAVDDPASRYYNCIVDASTVQPDWKSSEKMNTISLYSQGFVINHNFPNPTPGRGSAIFFHVWRSGRSGTGGCTASRPDILSSLLFWLDKAKAPVIAQLPMPAYQTLASAWHLPKISAAERYGLVDVSSIPGIQLDIRYATTNNVAGVRIYPKAVCYLRKEAAAALRDVQQELSLKGLGLKVFDGYRPLSVQQAMWDRIQDDRYVANPKVSKGRHTRGIAVDLTLVDANGQECTMPTPFDDFSETARSDNPNVSEAAKANRTLLKEVMERHRFTQLSTEWWHFDYEGWNDDVSFPTLDVPFDVLD